MAKPKPTRYLSGLSRSQAKQKVADAGYAARTGEKPLWHYRALQREFLKRYPDPVAQRQADLAARADRPSRSGSRTQKTSILRSSNSVKVTQVGQEESHWCGPATAYMILDQLRADGKVKSSKSVDGEELSQNTLAEDYLGANGGGGTYRTDIRDGLNEWVGKDLFSVVNNPSARQFTSNLMQNVDSRQAIAVSTFEPAGEKHYNGHPSGMTTDHWIVAKGYQDNGEVTEFADGGTTIWPNAERYFTYDTKTFIERYVEPQKAIVW